ncbi:MAG: GtrA family protein [Rickettsiales bacterium]|jgi:putative flippase GtrA|nr:GtrA family protein [Rickettsiales bacterium]
MIELYRKIEGFWFARVPQKLRYLLVGGFNTCAAYAIFASLYMWIGGHAAAVSIQYAVSINISVATMRYYVFRGRGSFWYEYRRAVGVYLVMLGFNYLWIWAARGAIPALLSQALYIIVETVAVYFLHKNFSFRE